ncbi:MAG: CapA family protein [Clostridia bacterium]|nr:CapA family protein [Clostridia bacterium]
MKRDGKYGKRVQKKRKRKLRIDRVIIVSIILFVIIYMINNIFQNIGQKIEYANINKENAQVTALSEDYKIETLPDITISMAVIGDIMCHNTQYKSAYANGKYDFSHVFEDIKSKIEPADIAIGNLETTFAGSDIGYSSYPTFNTPEALATDLKELGIDVLSTANNHSLDKGYTGVERTIKYLDEAGIAHTGTYNSEDSAQQITALEVNGMKIGFLAYTYGTNGIPVPKGKPYCINLINKEKILSDLNKAKQLNLDLIVVQMHWGQEYQAKPNQEQKDLADFLFQNGADIILGSHPHVLQSMEKREVTMPDGSKKQGFVIYSLGNFVSGQVKANTRQSVILNIQLTKCGKTNAISIDSVDYTPIYTFKGNRYRILDINHVLQNHNNGDTTYGSGTITTLKTELQQIKSRIGEPIK